MSKLTKYGRISYVEPNLTKDGDDFQVKLEDLSISVDLLVTVESRFSKNTGVDVVNGDGDLTYKLSWLTNSGDSTSFLTGKKLNANNKETFLTTYYTDITYNDGKNGEVIEGLGMTNINIDFDSWYMPKIDITFTDVRGISVFTPNEYEYNNDNESDNISNGFFKCFMTFPYPLFTLVIKGFYGEPVTYKLNCTNFNTKFNSNIGNFESTVNFIGYNYSFLSDIQFEYLKAAPYDKYAGKKYFEEQSLNNPNWNLGNGTKMVTLLELEQNIANAVVELKKLSQTDKKIKKLSEIDSKIAKINAIKNTIRSLMLDLQTNYGAKVISLTDNNQYAYFFSPSNIDEKINTYELKLNSDTIGLFRKSITYVNEYNSTNPNTLLKHVNNINTTIPDVYSLKLTRLLDGNNNIVPYEGSNGDNFLNVKLPVRNDDLKFNDNIATKIVNEMKTSQSYPKFVYILELNNLLKDCDDIINQYENERKEMRKYVSQFIDNETKNLLGFSPTIGNISKIIFAHLDTLMYSLYTCTNSIKNRRLDGDITEHSDINFIGGNQSIPPFPAVRGVDPNTNLYVDKWIGEAVNNDVEEAHLIYGFNRAVEQIVDANNQVAETLNSTNSSKYIPYFLMDVALNSNPFEGFSKSDKSIGELISLIGLRGMNVSNICDNIEYLTDAGKVDALNFFYANSNTVTYIQEIMSKLGVSNGSGSENAKNKICNYLQHNEESLLDTTNTYTYEMIENQKMFNLSNNTGTNSFIKIKDNDIIPTANKPFKGVNSYILDYCLTSGKNFEFPKSLTEDNTFFYSNSDEFVIDSHNDWTNNYTNKSRFTIVEDDDYAESIVSFYNSNKDKPINDDNLKDNVSLSNLLKDEIWQVDKDKFIDFYNSKATIASNDKDNKKYDEYKIPARFLTDEELNNTDEIPKVTFRELELNGSENPYKYESTKKIASSSNNFYLPAFYTIGNGETLFGSPFYYQQNENTYDEQDRIKTKALLFLHTFPINRNACANIFSDKNPRIENIPMIVSLLIGGLLWRKRFCEDMGLDDCVTYYGDYFVFASPQNSLKSKTYETMMTPSGRTELGLYVDMKVVNAKRYTFPTYKADLVKDWFNYDIFELDYSIKNKFIKLFEDWAVRNNKGFGYIINNFELQEKIESGYRLFNAVNFVQKVVKFSKVIDKVDNYENMKFIRDNFKPNILSSYFTFAISKNKKGYSLLLYNRDTTDCYHYVTTLFTQQSLLIFTNPYIKADNKKPISFKYVNFESYVNSFISTLSQLVSDSNDNKNKDPNKVNPTDVVPYNELYNAMYLYFKKIYDSWMIGKGHKNYDLETFYGSNFVFVDSFYNDISDKLIINCEYLLNRLRQNVSSSSLYSFLADLYAQHGCLFVAIPNYVNWNDDESVAKIFEPLPYIKAQSGDSNKFVVMYVHEPSKNLNMNNSSNGKYGYKDDSFEIFNPNLKNPEGKDISEDRLLDVFNDGLTNKYKVPAFGVAFAKQNQSFFKNINVSMSNPVTTEASINAMYQIAENGGNNSESKAAFWGQDLYRVWSNYSYTCEFEMMGCAQIQPLMYFQLFNIPLFRGTYMITKVVHNIKPGYMTTKVTGVRLCKYGKPFVTEAFGVFNLINKQSGRLTGQYEVEGDENINEIPNGEQKYNNNVISLLKTKYTYYDPDNYDVSDYDDCGECNCGNGFEGVVPEAKKLFIALRRTIETDYEGKWNVCVFSGKRNKTGTSDHNTGHAIDLAVVDANGQLTGRKTELAIAFDILLTCYSKYIRQLIWESKTKGTTASPMPTQCVHFAVKNSNKDTNSFQVFQAYLEGDNYITLRDKNVMSDTFLYCLAKKYNNANYTDSSIRLKVLSFTSAKDKNGNLIKTNVTSPKELLNEYYGRTNNETTEETQTLSSDNNKGRGLIFGENVKNCPDYDSFAEKVTTIGLKYNFSPDYLMISMMAESGLNPQAQNGSVAVGLIQFTSSGAQAAGTSKDALLNMNANEQINYVEKFFDSNKNSLMGKIKRPVDLHLYIMQPSRFVNGSFSSMDSVVLEKGSDGWNGNKGMIGGEDRDILVRDVQNWLLNRAKSFAKSTGYSQNIDKALAEYYS